MIDRIGFSDSVSVTKLIGAPHDRVIWIPKWTITKYANDEAFRNGEFFDRVEIQGNLLLNVGATRLLNLLIGNTSNPYDSANAQIGVGDSSAAESPEQTDLQGTNTLFKGMDSGFPQVTGQTATFRATFGGTEANFGWKEFGVRNGANELLNRRVSDQGEKTSGQTWVITLNVTVGTP